MSELKPCPFCGCKVSFVRGCHGWNKVIGEHSNKCPLDGNNLLTWSSEENAPILDKWNTREDCWISADDEAPRLGEIVLIYKSERVFSQSNIESCQFTKYGFERSYVTHWMPLPPPPETKK